MEFLPTNDARPEGVDFLIHRGFSEYERARMVRLDLAGLTAPEPTPPADPAAYSMILSHLFGTARMSVRPQDGVVGADFRVHGTQNLYVVDSSVFPTNLGVNPQHTIMAIARLAAMRVAAKALSKVA